MVKSITYLIIHQIFSEIFYIGKLICLNLTRYGLADQTYLFIENVALLDYDVA